MHSTDTHGLHVAAVGSGGARRQLLGQAGDRYFTMAAEEASGTLCAYSCMCAGFGATPMAAHMRHNLIVPIEGACDSGAQPSCFAHSFT